MSRSLLPTLNNQEEKVIDKIIAALIDYIWLESMHVTSVSSLALFRLKIRHHQRGIPQDGKEVYLIRLEYSTLVSLASNPGIVFTQTQIFEAIWNMDSNSFHSSVVNVI